MTPRPQKTIARAVEVAGIGFLSGADINLRFRPAPADHGIAFVRTDRLLAPAIPARVEYTVPRQRRTAIERCGIVVEMIEHVMAALAGLSIDNCIVELNGSEPPGCDGSSIKFVEALLAAGSVELDLPQRVLQLSRWVCVKGDDDFQCVTGSPSTDGTLTISYNLDYGPDSPITSQNYSLTVTPENFVSQVAHARTFLFEHEAHALRAAGFGRRTTARDLLIFDERGVIDNQLRAPDECARHKILDCIGDLALCGRPLVGKIEAHRSGHQLNAEFVRRLKLAHAEEVWPETVKRAA